MSPGQAAQVEALFEVLANDTRLRLLHEIVRQEEVCVGDLANALEMKPQAISNQLQRLADKGIVGCRRSGTSILYRIVDSCVTVLLDRGLCLIEEAENRKEVR
jgi:DNA-binding transcriptional ArsR family regulator